MATKDMTWQRHVSTYRLRPITVNSHSLTLGDCIVFLMSSLRREKDPIVIKEHTFVLRFYVRCIQQTFISFSLMLKSDLWTHLWTVLIVHKTDHVVKLNFASKLQRVVRAMHETLIMKVHSLQSQLKVHLCASSGAFNQALSWDCFVKLLFPRGSSVLTFVPL